MKSIFWRLVLVGVFTLIALLLFLPSTKFKDSLPSFWADNIPKIVLGLDLQGGMHLVLEVDQDKAVENRGERIADSVADTLREDAIPFTEVRSTGSNTIKVSYIGEKTLDSIKRIVGEEYLDLTVKDEAPGTVTYEIPAEEVERIKEWASSQAIETIRNRIDKFGVAEPLIQKQGEKEIVVQLPGLKDADRAISLIGRTAVLEFRLVDEDNDPALAAKGSVPFGDELMYMMRKNPVTGEDDRTPILVKKTSPLTGDLLSDARVSIDTQFNEPYVSITFDKQGAKIFERLTEQNVGKRMAIILDGKVHSAPNIRERISGGQASITGGFDYAEAADLAIILRSGALPAPVKIIQNVTVGPSLGEDSINAGINAMMLGGGLVLIFMIFYYRASGVIADITVLLNIIMLLGAMAYFNATLTLPGIAGIILTIGMGVDSNVLIFERIREELRMGRTPRSAVNAGFEHAFWTIIDAHVTTLITAAVLFQFGSGPIKGFAVTLSLGILINLFTALVGTKVAFDIQNSTFKVKRLSI